ncbi:hypothetical protein BpHYR1_004643 [Brachionus plicatilis]|uniref:Uncharacterized protein n=1 Tax=Brachionus plicatilis TaxID=10195 RepID=A0A3M7S812_BRAPC|nr:hypothetical protein BpHYR1_004643 [Brachionus plicatilis]
MQHKCLIAEHVTKWNNSQKTFIAGFCWFSFKLIETKQDLIKNRVDFNSAMFALSLLFLSIYSTNKLKINKLFAYVLCSIGRIFHWFSKPHLTKFNIFFNILNKALKNWCSKSTSNLVPDSSPSASQPAKNSHSTGMYPRQSNTTMVLKLSESSLLYGLSDSGKIYAKYASHLNNRTSFYDNILNVKNYKMFLNKLIYELAN